MEMMKPVIDGMVKSGEEMYEKELVLLENRIKDRTQKLQLYLENM